jgi:hypothetical protein
MIQANELRIGNKILYTHPEYESLINNVTVEDIEQCLIDNCGFNKIHAPIHKPNRDMKKTAIQELINELNEEVSSLEPNQYSWHCLMNIIEMAESNKKQLKRLINKE